MPRTNLRSIKFFSRGRTTEQRGYVLISAIALAILYFGLMELMLIDSARALRESQRFRARVMAATLAESAAELAAAQMVNGTSNAANAQDDQGKMNGALNRTGNDFELNGEGVTSGVPPVRATVRVQGRIEGSRVMIDYTFHSQ
jgi:Tfp pilus assembly protein PilX